MRISLRFCLRGLGLCLLAAVLLIRPAGAEIIEIDPAAKGQAFPHFWERIFGSGRAVLSLRESYRSDLRETAKATGLQYVRFHGILHDENGVYDEDAAGKPVYNFSYVDQIYDGLLQNGVRPFVEISFMPRKLAAKQAPHAFWYKPLVSPPRDWRRWAELIERFVGHLVERYGIEEVSHWYFEVWNEPNIDFWIGEPKEATYHRLYDETARAVKRVSKRLRVGGPATAQAAWVDRFIRHCKQQRSPVDFVSSHVYANDTAADVFGTQEVIPRRDMVYRAVKKVHDQVAASPMPDLPIHFSEYNASYMNEVNVTDSTFMGPWLANTIRMCDGLLESMDYWTFSDVFEEQGVVKKPFYGGYGLMAAGGIRKPAFNAFALLHRLGTERIPAHSDSVLATRRSDGSLAIAMWNYSAPGEKAPAKELTLAVPGGWHASIWRLDSGHGSSLTAWEEMGKPAYPTRLQQQALREAGRLLPPANSRDSGGKLSVSIPSQGLVLVELAGQTR